MMLNSRTRLRRWCVTAILIVAFALNTYQMATAQEAEAWNQARQKNPLAGYADFFRQYPNTTLTNEIRKVSGAVIVEAVRAEARKQNARFSKKGVRNGDSVSITGWFGEGASVTIATGELRLGKDFVILTDPTAPFEFTGEVLPGYPYAFAKVVSGRGVVIQYRPDYVWVFVFDVEVSSVVKEWYDWSKK